MASTKCAWKRGSTAVSTFACGLIQQGDARAGARGVAGRIDLRKLAVRDHAEHHGVFYVDVTAEGAGEHDAVDRVDLEPVHQQAGASVERRLGQLDRAHVVLHDADLRLALANQVGEGAALGLNARRALSQAAVDGAVAQDDAGEVHLGQRLDNARAADAGDAGLLGRLGEARVVGPEIRADHPEARLQGLAVDAHPLDGAGGGALAAGDLRPLEGRPGRRGTGQQALLVAEHDLGVGADVDHQGHLVAQVRTFRQDDAGRVGAHVAGDAGQDIGAGVGMEMEVELLGPEGDARVGGEREGRAAELRRIDAQQQVMHDRVADEGGVEDLLFCNPCFFGHLLGEVVDGLAHHLGHLFLAAGVHHHVADPAHEVFTEADLRVHDARGGHHLAGREIAEVGRDGGRPDVDREPVGLVDEAGPGIGQGGAAMD
jgi:hypothetical protein